MMEDFSSPSFFDSYYGAEAEVEKGESFHDLLPQVDWLFEDDAHAYPLPPMPTPVPVAEEGALFSEEKKKKNNNNKETVSFPGFPALKQLQPQPQEVVSEDSANTGTNTTSCPPQGKKRSAPEASGSDLDCSCCEEDSSKSDAKKPKVEGADVQATATTKRKEKSNSSDTTVALDRKEKNRRSAALSRERKKAAMDSMLLRCKALESTNATLNYLLSMANVEIQALRRELASSNTSARSVGNKGQKSTETEQTGPTYLPAVQKIDNNTYNLDFLKLESPRSLCRPVPAMDTTLQTSSLDYSRACQKKPMEKLRYLLFTLVVATHHSIHMQPPPQRGQSKSQMQIPAWLKRSSMVARDTIGLLQQPTSPVLKRWLSQKKKKKKEKEKETKKRKRRWRWRLRRATTTSWREMQRTTSFSSLFGLKPKTFHLEDKLFHSSSHAII